MSSLISMLTQVLVMRRHATEIRNVIEVLTLLVTVDDANRDFVVRSIVCPYHMVHDDCNVIL
jgi:hypothetical protein